MARVSRRGAALRPASRQEEKVWNTAVYARLSIEDGGRKDSDSIEVQAELAAQYIAGRSYLKLTDTYIDNGSTGTNFDRPEFNRLMNDIRSGRINCVVVKDLSRFGRNYVEACELLDKIFPFLRVRFISVNDGYDSETDTGLADSLIVMLKNLINDAYVKDISRKSISARKAQRERGEYTGAFAPYGYKKSETEKGKLVPDAETAPIIHDIFRWRSEGMGRAAIAKRLDDLGIPCPSMRLRNGGTVKGEGYYKASIWQPKAIDRIIKSRVYLGHLVQGKTKQAYCERQPLQFVPESEWCVVENSHEPIVSAELWNAANRVCGERREAYFENLSGQCYPENALKGLLVCAACGSKLVRKRNFTRGHEYYYYFCPLEKQHDEQERYAAIPARKMYDLVLAAVTKQVKLASDIGGNLQEHGNSSKSRSAALDANIARAERDLRDNTKKSGALYEDYVFGLLNEGEYIYAKEKYQRTDAALKQELAESRRQKETLTDAISPDSKLLAAVEAFLNPVELSRDMAVALIERIEVKNPDEIEIVWKHRDEFALMEAFAKDGAA